MIEPLCQSVLLGCVRVREALTYDVFIAVCAQLRICKFRTLVRVKNQGVVSQSFSFHVNSSH
jgi:hypothetical protein